MNGSNDVYILGKSYYLSLIYSYIFGVFLSSICLRLVFFYLPVNKDGFRGNFPKVVDGMDYFLEIIEILSKDFYSIFVPIGMRLSLRSA